MLHAMVGIVNLLHQVLLLNASNIVRLSQFVDALEEPNKKLFIRRLQAKTIEFKKINQLDQNSFDAMLRALVVLSEKEILSISNLQLLRDLPAQFFEEFRSLIKYYQPTLEVDVQTYFNDQLHILQDRRFSQQKSARSRYSMGIFPPDPQSTETDPDADLQKSPRLEDK